MYDRLGDLKMYLAGSILMYNSRPVYVELAQESKDDYDNKYKLRLALKFLSSDKIKWVDADDPLLSMQSPPLGYVNRGGIAQYLKRNPLRHYKKGLTQENLSTRFHPNELLRLLHNKYPTFKEAAGALSNHICSSVAFHKDWCIDEAALFFKKQRVGYYDPIKREYKLSKDFKFLTTRFNEAKQ